MTRNKRRGGYRLAIWVNALLGLAVAFSRLPDLGSVAFIVGLLHIGIGYLIIQLVYRVILRRIMKTRAQRVTFRAIFATFAIVSLVLAVGNEAEDPIAMFAAILVPGLVAGLIVALLVIWVMKAFSEPPQQDSDDEADPPQENKKTPMKMLICLFLISMMSVFLGCDTPNPPAVSANKKGLTAHEKAMIDAAWNTGQLTEKNWGIFLERLRNEPDRKNAVKNALSNSEGRKWLRGLEKRRRLLDDPGKMGRLWEEFIEEHGGYGGAALEIGKQTITSFVNVH